MKQREKLTSSLRALSAVIPFCALALALAVEATAFAQYSPENRLTPSTELLEIGGGVAFLSDRPVDAFFRVDYAADAGRRMGSHFIVVRTNTTATLGENGVRYLDLHVNSLGWENGDAVNGYGLTLLNLDIQRNVATNQGVSLRVTFLGVHAQLETQVEPNLNFILRASADLIGLGYTQRLSDGASLVGLGTGASIEAALRINQRFRIAFGDELGLTSGKPREVYGGDQCDTVYTYGRAYTSCYNTTGTRWDDQRLTNSAYLNFTADIIRNLQAFGEARYSIYSVSDATGSVRGSLDGAFQLFLGVQGHW